MAYFVCVFTESVRARRHQPPEQHSDSTKNHQKFQRVKNHTGYVVLTRLQIKLLTPPFSITPHPMPILVAPRTRLIKLTQAVLLRDPITSIGAVVFDRDESMRADGGGPGVAPCMA
jgi:hypothetical protein